MIRGIHHPGITTGNLDRLLSFYRDLLGFREISRFGWEAGSEMSAYAGQIIGIADSTARAVLLRAGNAFVEIFEYQSPASTRSDDHGMDVLVGELGCQSHVIGGQPGLNPQR